MLAILCAYLAGAVGWTFTEYVLHRFVFHGASARGPGAKEHRRHHAQVEYFAPSWQKALAALAATAILFPLLALLLGLPCGAAATLGFVAMYVLYEVLHRRAHTHPPRNRYGRWRRKNHFAHHFSDPRRAQGVTTPLWDIVLSTRLSVDRVRVPRRLAMRWLVDEQGVIFPAYADDYILVGSSGRDKDTQFAGTQASAANEALRS